MRKHSQVKHVDNHILRSKYNNNLLNVILKKQKTTYAYIHIILHPAIYFLVQQTKKEN